MAEAEPWQFYLFAEKPMVGQLILGFCSTTIRHLITKCELSEVKVGFGGWVGNKGGVHIRF